MDSSFQLDRISQHALARQLAPELLTAATNGTQVTSFLKLALDRVRAVSKANFAALSRNAKGHWETLASSGSTASLQRSTLSEALDREAAVSNGQWAAAPLDRHAAGGEVLVLCCSTGGAGELESLADALAGLLALGLHTARDRQRSTYRLEQLETILEIAATWNKTLELRPLLEQMAEASTRLLKAERASIFLWDRNRGELVGRPALGVEGGELRIADSAGIVGQVVQTGEPRSVEQETGQDQINRGVDKQLQFETRTLLCVPLRRQSGEMLGAFEMINKIEGNFSEQDLQSLTELANHAAVAIENSQQFEQLLDVQRQLADEAAAGVRLIGEAPSIDSLRNTIRRVADTDLAILILGENGTGKEVVAQLTHYLSQRRHEPMVAVNCAALPDTLLESELFGHEQGAFTDARETRAGKFELAAQGTLFLDEIGDMSLSGQAKLLRALEEKTIVRVGGSQTIQTDSRVIAATNQDLVELVREGKFREDLFYRLNVVTIDLPPLRERGDDILLLADHFLTDFSVKARRQKPTLTAAAKKRMVQHNWPGNVRELRNLMERVAYLSQDDKIDADELAFILSPRKDHDDLPTWNLPLTEATKEFQIRFIQKQIEMARGNMTDAARRLGLHRSNLYRKMRQLEMDNSEEPHDAALWEG